MALTTAWEHVMETECGERSSLPRGTRLKYVKRGDRERRKTSAVPKRETKEGSEKHK